MICSKERRFASNENWIQTFGTYRSPGIGTEGLESASQIEINCGTHSFHQLGETKIGAQGIEQEVGLEAR